MLSRHIYVYNIMCIHYIYTLYIQLYLFVYTCTYSGFNFKKKCLISQAGYQHIGFNSPTRNLVIHQIHVKQKTCKYKCLKLCMMRQ